MAQNVVGKINILLVPVVTSIYGKDVQDLFTSLKSSFKKGIFIAIFFKNREFSIDLTFLAIPKLFECKVIDNQKSENDGMYRHFMRCSNAMKFYQLRCRWEKSHV
jgi:hypothetical protein